MCWSTRAVASRMMRCWKFATVAPAVALAGGVHLEHGVEIGIGARVAPRLRIARGAVVGAGAVVISAVPAGVTVAGVPARELRPPVVHPVAVGGLPRRATEQGGDIRQTVEDDGH